jgi:tetratricopeptide (TPR) repeat protein
MKLKYWRELHLISLLLGCCIAAFGQIPFSGTPGENSRLGGSNVIAGTIHWPDGSRADRRISVKIRPQTGGDFMLTTDESGQFVLINLTAGYYDVIVDREENFEPASQTVEIVANGDRLKPVYTVSIRLKEKLNRQAKPTVLDSVSASAPKRSTEYYLKSIELSKKGDHSAAIEQLKLAVTEFPGFVNAYNEMGVQYMKLNDLEKADIALQAALKIKPDSFEPLLNRGIVLLRQKRYADSEAALKSALAANASSAVAQYYLGRTLTALERFDDAEQALKQSITLSGDTLHEAHRMLANLYIARGNDARAIEELEKYLTLVPAASDAENLRKIIAQLKTARPVGKPN